jgi:hypothetical protein
MPEISEPSPRTRTSLFKLRARQCRFIVSDGQTDAIFCGGETQEGSSWCPWHRRLVYAKPLAGGAREPSRSVA